MAGHPRKITSSLAIRRTGPALFLAVCLLTAWTFANRPALSSDIVYKYVDENGVAFFTDNYQNIPTQHLERMQALDATTLQPATPRGNVPATPSPPSTPTAQEVPQAQQSEAPPQMAEAWLARLSQQRIPLPTQFQLGVGLTSLILIIGIIMVRRASQNPALKLLLKVSIMFVLGSTVYTLYLSGLNERVSQATNEPTGRTTSGKELLGDVKGKAGQAKQILDKTVLAPVKEAIEKTKAATVGDVTKTVNEANRANQQLDKDLRAIESTP
ncbi:MAG: hypothetical protein HZA21_05200 [Nitrospirae bacterium]|nr:hypothetical protein [Nitrospirota bacterium]